MVQRLLALIAALGAAACASTTVEPPVDGPWVGLQVNGSVRTPDGAPVVGAELEVWARRPDTCTGGFADDRATVDSTGTFSATLGTWNVPHDVCVWIAVVPPAGSTAIADTVTYRPARLEFASPTVQVHIVLPTSPGS